MLFSKECKYYRQLLDKYLNGLLRKKLCFVQSFQKVSLRSDCRMPVHAARQPLISSFFIEFNYQKGSFLLFFLNSTFAPWNY